MSFEWQTENDTDWEEPEAPSVPKPPRQPWRWSRLLLVALVLLAATAVFGWRQLQQQVNTATSSVEDDVLASVNVVRQAAVDQDTDLFTTFLSGRDAAWAQAQETAVRDNAFFGRSAFGLAWQPAPFMAAPVITLSPDLKSATVVLSNTYALPLGNGITETVMLTQAHVYRLGPNRWLYAPPESDFWGEEQFYDGRYLHMRYPARDTAVAQRLAFDLDNKLLEMCNQLDADGCPRDLRLRLLLTPTAGIQSGPGVLTIFDEATNSSHLEITPMPPPSLVGVPLDGTGYEAVYRGYARLVVTAVLNHLLAGDCCAQQPFYQAARARQLQQLGLLPVPERTAVPLTTLTDMAVLWEETAVSVEAEAQIAAFLDFLMAEEGVAVTAVQRSISQNPSVPFETWLQSLLPNRTREQFQRRWLLAQYQAQSVAELETPLPQQSVLALCQPDSVGTMALTMFDPQTGVADIVQTLAAENGFLAAAPNHTGVAVAQWQVADNYQLLWHRNGVTRRFEWPRSEDAPGSFPLVFSPDGDRLIVGGRSVMGELDWEMCADCAPNLTLGYPHWSPDGSRVVLASGQDVFDPLSGAELFLTLALDVGVPQSEDDFFEGLAGRARLPFWLDNDHVGYVQFSIGTGGDQIWVEDVETLTPERLVSLAELMEDVPEDERPSQADIVFVTMNPADLNELLIVTSEVGRTQAGFLFGYDLTSQEVTVYLTPVGSEPGVISWHPFSRFAVEQYDVSPDGRYFLTFGQAFESAAIGYQLHLFDFQTNEVQLLSLHEKYPYSASRYVDWSANGRWLVTAQDGYLRLFAPESGTERLLISDSMRCEQAVWGEW